MDFQTGIVFIEGLPGAGKSFAAVEELVRQIVKNKRQVFTNLPMSDAVLRKYLRRTAGRDAFANLYVPLTETHWRRFLERAERVSNMQEQWSAELDDLGVKRRSSADFLKWYDEKTGDKAITRGKDANWIPTGAVVILDEAHKWCPQSGAHKDSTLLGYTSMHRHFYHLIYCVTQHPMNVAIEFRRMAKTYIRVDNAGSLPILGPITLNRLGLATNLARYCYYSPETYKLAADSGGVQGSPDRTRIVWFTLKRHIWKLYNSNVHAGMSRAEQRRLHERVLDEAGVELPKADKPRKKHRKRTTMVRRFAGLFRLACYGLVLFVTLILGVTIGRHTGESTSETPEQAGTPTEILTDATTTIPTLEYLSDQWARLDGERVDVGTTHRAHVLLSVSRDDGYAVVVPVDGDGDAWLLVPGREPESLGAADQLLARFRDEARRRFAEGGIAGPEQRATTESGSVDPGQRRETSPAP